MFIVNGVGCPSSKKRPRYHALPTSHGWLAWRLEEMDEEGEETQSANAVRMGGP